MRRRHLPARVLAAPLIVLGAFGCVGADAPCAHAHASLLGASPSPGARLQNAAGPVTLRFSAPLARAAYRVDWHTVSTEDGHELEGSFGIGVGTAAGAGSHSVQQSPLADAGWLRALTRALLYVALLSFAGGLILRALLERGEP